MAVAPDTATGAAGSVAVQVSGLTKSYGDVPAVRRH